MRSVLAIFFVLNIFSVNAQDKQDLNACTQILSGEVRDKITTDVLPEAIVVLSDKNGNVIETQMVKEDGMFSFTIKCKTAYRLEGKKTDFTPESKTFTTDNLEGKVLKLLILLDKGNIDFVTDAKSKKVETDSLIKTEVAKPINIPDVTPDVTPNAILDVSPDIISTKPVYNPQLDPVYFDYESSWLNQKTKNELQKVVEFLKQNPNVTLECSGHTDSKGTNSYNQWMSDRRAKRVIDFLINQGIEPNRISGKGYGETRLINQCTDAVDCTNAQRADNRRVEFVIKKL